MNVPNVLWEFQFSPNNGPLSCIISEFQVNRFSEPGHRVLSSVNAFKVDIVGKSISISMLHVLSFFSTLSSLLLLFLHLSTPSVFIIYPFKCIENLHKQTHKDGGEGYDAMNYDRMKLFIHPGFLISCL